jgi:hypothetical protein
LSRIRRVPLGTALFFILSAAAMVTAVLVVRARTPDLVLEVTHPRAGGPTTLSGDAVRIDFFVREADGHARVAIVDSHEDVVKTLDDDVALAEDEPVSYEWDRSTDAGGQAAAGRYRLEVALPSEDRVMVWPARITLLPQAEETG